MQSRCNPLLGNGALSAPMAHSMSSCRSGIPDAIQMQFDASISPDTRASRRPNGRRLATGYDPYGWVYSDLTRWPREKVR